MKEKPTVELLNDVVIRFAGDSGDGMQLTGSLFSDVSAILGNQISTFPNYPAEIRAPQGSLAGVSSFQVRIGTTGVYTPGDYADVLSGDESFGTQGQCQEYKEQCSYHCRRISIR